MHMHLGTNPVEFLLFFTLYPIRYYIFILYIPRCRNGDAKSPFRESCTTVMPTVRNTTWYYHSCPIINECQLNLHKCHRNASCSDTLDSYSCKCNRGFIGNGFQCQET